MKQTVQSARTDCDVSTVYAAFARARATHGGNSFLHIPSHCPGGLVDLTYEQAGLRVEQIAAAYADRGYGRGHHVGLLLGNRSEFFLHWLALNSLDATVVPLSSDLAVDEMTYVIEHGDVDLLVHLTEAQAKIEKLRARGYAGPAVACGQVNDGRLPAACRPRSGSSEDRAAIVFTSGSTGRPKGCVLSNQYFLSFGRWYRDLGGRCELREGQERLITPLPVNHVNALAFSSMGMILTSGCIIQLDRFQSSTWRSTVQATGATVMHYLGVMPAMLLQLSESTEDRVHSVRFGIGGGIRAEFHAAFESRFGFPLVEAWAMTETGGAGTISTHEGPRHRGSGCIGKPSPAYSVARVVDDDGKPVAHGETGELVVRAVGSDPRAGFFSGYYKDPEATDAAWRGGWLHTGDLVRADAEGSIFFVARRKQIIRRSGENISAAEVETVLGADPRVGVVAVVPVPDPVRDEEVFACIVLREGTEPTLTTAETILQRAADSVSYFKLPGFIAFVSALPVTATQKLRYGAVSDQARALVSRGAAGLFDLRETKGRMRRRVTPTN